MLDNTPYLRELTEIASLLKIYRVYDENGLISLRRLGKDNDGGYVVPEKALQIADVVMGYGIENDSSFEEAACEIYGKRSYGFDGSVILDKFVHPLFHFTPTYLISDAEMKMKTLEKVPTKYSSFDEHLKIFHLQGKKIFVKMDIETYEYSTIPDILRYTPQITGISFEMHFAGDQQIPHALRLLQQLQKDFLLVNLHGNNIIRRFQAPNVRGEVPRLLELTYINKNIITRFELSENQKHPTPIDMPSDARFPDREFEIL